MSDQESGQKTIEIDLSITCFKCGSKLNNGLCKCFNEPKRCTCPTGLGNHGGQMIEINVTNSETVSLEIVGGSEHGKMKHETVPVRG